MFTWLKTRVHRWTVRQLEKEIERLKQENREAQEEYLRLSGGQPIVLTEEEKEQLRQTSRGIDREWLEANSMLDPKDWPEEEQSDKPEQE